MDMVGYTWDISGIYQGCGGTCTAPAYFEGAGSPWSSNSWRYSARNIPPVSLGVWVMYSPWKSKPGGNEATMT